MTKQQITRNRKTAGFTLLELMIVVAVLAIVMTMALPALSGARRTANEGAAIAQLRTITTVMEQWKARFGSYPMAWDLLEGRNYVFFDGDVGAVYAGAVNARGNSGYTFLISAHVSTPWRVFAVPNELNVTGDRHFYVDATGVIRHNSAGMAGPGNPAIE